MSEDETFAIIAEERRELADVLATLDDEQWSTPSLCEGWTTRVVLGHLMIPLVMSVPKVVLGALRYRGNFDKFSDAASRKLAQQPTEELVRQLRDKAENRFKPP